MTKTATKKEKRPRAKPRLAELAAKGVILSQAQIGRLMEPQLDATTVSKHMSGERGMSRDQVIGYATIFKVPTHEIFLLAEETTDA